MYTAFESQAWTTEQEDELGELALEVAVEVDVDVADSEHIDESESERGEVLDDEIEVKVVELADEVVVEVAEAELEPVLKVLPAMLFLMLSHFESG